MGATGAMTSNLLPNSVGKPGVGWGGACLGLGVVGRRGRGDNHRVDALLWFRGLGCRAASFEIGGMAREIG